MPQYRHSAYYRLLGLRLWKARIARGLSQAAVAKEIGYGSQSRIAYVEDGERRLDVFELLDLTDLYGLDLKELLEDPRDDEEKAVFWGRQRRPARRKPRPAPRRPRLKLWY